MFEIQKEAIEQIRVRACALKFFSMAVDHRDAIVLVCADHTGCAADERSLCRKRCALCRTHRHGGLRMHHCDSGGLSATMAVAESQEHNK